MYNSQKSYQPQSRSVAVGNPSKDGVTPISSLQLKVNSSPVVNRIRHIQDQVQNGLNQNTQPPVQRLKKKLGMDDTKYSKLLMDTVVLYAELDGKPVGEDKGIFMTAKGGHAEENLIKYLQGAGDLSDSKLEVWLSTSPCSSVFCTRDDGEKGCQERLEALEDEDGLSVKVHADHLYQPQFLATQEAELGGKGLSSFGAATTSKFDIKFSKLPKKLMDEDMIEESDETVAQLNVSS